MFKTKKTKYIKYCSHWSNKEWVGFAGVFFVNVVLFFLMWHDDGKLSNI